MMSVTAKIVARPPTVIVRRANRSTIFTDRLVARRRVSPVKLRGLLMDVGSGTERAGVGSQPDARARIEGKAYRTPMEARESVAIFAGSGKKPSFTTTS